MEEVCTWVYLSILLCVSIGLCVLFVDVNLCVCVFVNNSLCLGNYVQLMDVPMYLRSVFEPLWQLCTCLVSEL